MAKQSIQLYQEKLSCSICLALLKDPVTIPCGHSYCMNCIKIYWDEEDPKKAYSCPQCRQSFRPRPVLGKNTMLADLVEELKKSRQQAAPADHCFAGPEDVACDFCTGRKLKALKSCLQCLVSYCEQHLQPHYESPAFEKHKLVNPSKNLQENICSRHNESMDKHKGHGTTTAEADMTERQRELAARRQQIRQRIKDKENNLKVLQQEEETIDKLLGILSEELIKIKLAKTGVDVLLLQAEPRTRADFLQYSCQITLDQNTAHTYISFKSSKKVYWHDGLEWSSHPDRFTVWSQVLCRESLTGRCYWEVELSGEVFVAVAYKDVSRKGDGSVFGNNDKSWALECFDDGYEFRHNKIRTSVSGPQSSRVGVYLDHSAGILSFYSVSDTMTLLHRVQTTFTQPLCPGLGIYYDGSSADFCDTPAH